MKQLYFLIRVPKSGSQSMWDMVRSALPENRCFRLPMLAPDPSKGITLYDRFRLRRRSLKGFWKVDHSLTEAQMWKRIDEKSNDGDIIAGHINYGTPQLPQTELKCITLLRHPIDRLVSEYNYHRQGYQARPAFHQSYMAGLLKMAGTRSFSDYVAYLHDHLDVFQNMITSYIVGPHRERDPFEFMKENYFHFGVLEEMDFFADQLSKKLKRPIKSTWINQTRNLEKHELSSTDESRLHDLLGKDMKLYGQALDFVLAQKAALGCAAR